jgi:hypothetical protein
MDPLSKSLPGTWSLRSRIDVTAAGVRHPEPSLGDDPIALLISDRAGHFAAQFLKRDRTTTIPVATVAGQNNSRAQGGYDASFGSYTVDDARSEVTQRLDAALPRKTWATC